MNLLFIHFMLYLSAYFALQHILFYCKFFPARYMHISCLAIFLLCLYLAMHISCLANILLCIYFAMHISYLQYILLCSVGNRRICLFYKFICCCLRFFIPIHNCLQHWEPVSSHLCKTVNRIVVWRIIFRPC